MTSPELLIVTTLKALVEIAALSLLAQALIGIMAGRAKQENIIYRMFMVVTSPILKITRIISPKIIADQHIGVTGFFILFWMWITLIFAKGYVCHAQNLACIPN